MAFRLYLDQYMPHILRGLRRLLRPGGRLVILEFPTPPGRLFRRLYDWCYTGSFPESDDWLSAIRRLTRTCPR